MILLQSTAETLDKSYSDSNQEERVKAINDLLSKLDHSDLNETQIGFITKSISELDTDDIKDNHINFLNWLEIQENNKKRRLEIAIKQKRTLLHASLHEEARIDKTKKMKIVSDSIRLVQGIDHKSNLNKDFMIAIIPIEFHNDEILDDAFVEEAIRKSIPGSDPMVLSMKGKYLKNDMAIDTKVNERPLNFYEYKSTFIKMLENININLFTQRFGRIFPDYIKSKTGMKSNRI